MQQKNSLRTSSCSMSWPVATRTTSMLWKLIASLKIGCRTWPCPDITLNCKGSVSPEQRLFGEWSDKNKPWMYNSTWMQIGRWWLGNQKKHFHQTKSNIECTSTCMCFPRICGWSNQKTRSNSHLIVCIDCTICWYIQYSHGAPQEQAPLELKGAPLTIHLDSWPALGFGFLVCNLWAFPIFPTAGKAYILVGKVFLQSWKPATLRMGWTRANGGSPVTGEHVLRSQWRSCWNRNVRYREYGFTIPFWNFSCWTHGCHRIHLWYVSSLRDTLAIFGIYPWKKELPSTHQFWGPSLVFFLSLPVLNPIIEVLITQIPNSETAEVPSRETAEIAKWNSTALTWKTAETTKHYFQVWKAMVLVFIQATSFWGVCLVPSRKWRKSSTSDRWPYQTNCCYLTLWWKLAVVFIHGQDGIQNVMRGLRGNISYQT